MLDTDVIEAFRAKAESAGTGYPTLINAALRDALSVTKEKKQKPLTRAALRRVLREELQAS
jgi:BrnA antitoxin of type II toxin-antitoxin system